MNYQIMKYGFLLLAMSMLTACSNTPTCSSEETQALVKEVAIDRIRDVLATRLSPYAGPQSYKFFKSDANNSGIQELVRQVDSIVEKTQFLIQDIRTLSSSDPRQALCAATFSTVGLKNHQALMIQDINIEVTYSAQYSDDGKTLHVNVEGL
ncbi:MAG: hypothetical protein ABIG70_08080 [Pseudomonadota bacterium]